MKEFNPIRAKAREKRDKTIATANAEYKETLVRIAALEKDLLGREISSHQRLSDCVERVIPNDSTFTTLDIMTALEALNPNRIWRKHSIDNYLTKLRLRGKVRRVRRSKNSDGAIYARVGVETEPIPFEGMVLADVIAEILGDKSMTQTEIVVAMREAGYDSMMTPKNLGKAVGTELRTDKKRFDCDGNKWAAIRR